jgi:hypothetical protein
VSTAPRNSPHHVAFSYAPWIFNHARRGNIIARLDLTTNKFSYEFLKVMNYAKAEVYNIPTCTPLMVGIVQCFTGNEFFV